MYHSRLYRLQTPDPAGKAAAKLGNPQSWDMHAYVVNNPTTLVDPSALQKHLL